MSSECEHQCAGAHELVVKDLSVSYGDFVALESVGFQTRCGSRLALLGPNGAGKSTLIRVLAGLMKPAAGEVSWRGSALTASTKEIAYLPQADFHQKNFPITVREVVEMGRFPHVGHFRKFSAQDEAHVERAIEAMQIASFADKQIDELSGGQQQRAFIARALAQEAHVILLDEPFNGLDVESRCHLADTLKDLAVGGHLIISSHHNIANVHELFDEALVVAKTQVAFGPVLDVMNQDEVRTLMHSCHPEKHKV